LSASTLWALVRPWNRRLGVQSSMSVRRKAPLGHNIRHKFPVSDRPAHCESHLQTDQRSNHWVIWFTSIGIFLPYTIGTTGKYVICVFFIPAVLRLFNQVSHGRQRIMASDLFVWATGLWMVTAQITRSGEVSWATESDAFAFVGSYIVARSYISSERALEKFISSFRIIAVLLVALSVLDPLSGQFFIINIMSDIFHTANAQLHQIFDSPVRGDVHRSLFGVTIIRATSTFAHPILYGTFCSVAAAIFLYSEQRLVPRLFYVAACLCGCILSVSSGPLLALMIAVSVYCYDYVLTRYSMRWKVLWSSLAALVCALFFLSNRPLGFLISHFTLDPATGYFRILIWQYALDYISMAPFTGNPPSAWAANDILSDTIDSVWLVLALLYGLPTICFLLLANLAACIRIGRGIDIRLLDLRMRRMRTAFSLVLAMFAFIGLTVHYWDAMWMFWGLCIGIRASIEEFGLARVHRPLPPSIGSLSRPLI
jgi:hypothetical protein